MTVVAVQKLDNQIQILLRSLLKIDSISKYKYDHARISAALLVHFSADSPVK
jgi:hypothetical protein